jgi:hypothetical protein
MSRILIVGLTALPLSMSRLPRQSGVLNISQPYRPPWPVTGIALLLVYFFTFLRFKKYLPTVVTELMECRHRRHVSVSRFFIILSPVSMRIDLPKQQKARCLKDTISDFLSVYGIVANSSEAY